MAGLRSMIDSKSLMLRHFTILAGAKRAFVHLDCWPARCAVVTSCNRRLQAQGSPARCPLFSATRNLDAQDLSGPLAQAVVLLPGELKTMASVRRLARMLAQLESEGVGGMSEAAGAGIGTGASAISDRKCVAFPTRRVAPAIGTRDRDHVDGVPYARPPRSRRRP